MRQDLKGNGSQSFRPKQILRLQKTDQPSKATSISWFALGDHNPTPQTYQAAFEWHREFCCLLLALFSSTAIGSSSWCAFQSPTEIWYCANVRKAREFQSWVCWWRHPSLSLCPSFSVLFPAICDLPELWPRFAYHIYRYLVSLVL